jgi:hypothetical protein
MVGATWAMHTGAEVSRVPLQGLTELTNNLRLDLKYESHVQTCILHFRSPVLKFLLRLELR